MEEKAVIIENIWVGNIYWFVINKLELRKYFYQIEF